MKYFHQAVLCAAVAAIIMVTDAQNTYADCSTNFTTLENALLDSSDNIFKLTTTYFHPDMERPLYANVYYKFDNFSPGAHYIWSASTLYFIVAPSALGYLSQLYTFVSNKRIVDLPLHLPADCAELANETDSTKENFLFVLTQRVSHIFLVQSHLQFISPRSTIVTHALT